MRLSSLRCGSCVGLVWFDEFLRKSNRQDTCCVAGVARHYTELIAWQLGDEIRQHVFEWTTRAGFRGNLRARDQIEGAADSVCHNIAEGFSGSHAEFARYLRIARGSLNEVSDCIRSAQLKRYVTSEEAAAVMSLIRRLFRALANLIAYLTTTADPPRPRLHDKPSPRRPARTDVRKNDRTNMR